MHNEVVRPPETSRRDHQASPTHKTPHDDDKCKDDDQDSKSSTSDTGSSDENIVDPFALLKLWDNVATVNSRIDKVIKDVSGIESKLDLALKSLSEIKANAPYELDQANRLDQIILLRLSHTLEDEKSRYTENMDYHISTVTIMLKVHDDMYSTSNTLIKQTHIQHEK